MKLLLFFYLGSLFFFSCDSYNKDCFVKISNTLSINTIDSMEYVWIPPGELKINSPVKDDSFAKTNDIRITNGFWMSKTEVSVGQFQRFMAQTNHITTAEKDNHKFNWKKPGFDQDPTHPVVYVSFDDIKAYTAWANCVLPNQIQWIYATKANTESDYYWGDDFNDNHVWYRLNSPTGSQPVGTKAPNPWGLHDMIGNVHEFVSVCDINYRLIGESWSRCDCYSSHNQGQIVHLNIGNLSKMKLADCNASPRINYSDDAGFRCVIR